MSCGPRLRAAAHGAEDVDRALRLIWAVIVPRTQRRLTVGRFLRQLSDFEGRMTAVPKADVGRYAAPAQAAFDYRSQLGLIALKLISISCSALARLFTPMMLLATCGRSVP